MQVLRIQTENGSTYLVGPSPTAPGRIRVARLSDHDVRGTFDSASFAVDVTTVEVAPGRGLLRLRWTEDDGSVIVTSPIRDVATWTVADRVSTPV